MPQEEKKNGTEPTLTDFIEKNQKLISTVGVLAALSVLTLKLPENQPGKFLSTILLALVFLLCIEIYTNFPWVERGRLYWFQEFFGLAVFGYALVWMSMFYPYVIAGLALIALLIFTFFIFVGFSWGIRKMMEATPWFKDMNLRTKVRLIPMLGAMALMLVMVTLAHHFKPHGTH